MNASDAHPSNGSRWRHDEAHDHDRGLQFDLSTLVQRRNVLKLFAGGAGLFALAACGSDTTAAPSGTATAASTAATATADTTATTAAATAQLNGSGCAVIPEETAGPYPGDGSNGVNMLTESGVVRSDIRSSFGSSTTVAAGVPVTVHLTVASSANGCAALADGAVYLWHCNIDGKYSLYDIEDENYLRGVQRIDANGLVTFSSIFPACYAGRWPHMHFEVYPSLESITDADNKLATSQLAMPKDVCEAVFATAGYEQSVRNLTQVSLATDNVFSDGAELETPVVTGNVDEGYVITLTVTV